VHAGRRYHPLSATEWSRLLLNAIICSERIPFRRCQGVMGVHSTFLSLVTYDLDIQTRPSKGPNIFPVNLAQMHSAIPEIFDSQTKKVTDSAKNRTLRSLLRVVTSAIYSQRLSCITYGGRELRSNQLRRFTWKMAFKIEFFRQDKLVPD